MPLESRQELSRLFFLTIFNQDSRRSIILLPDHLIKHHVVPNPKWYIPIQRTEPPGLVLTLLILLRGLPWLSAASASRRTFYVPCLASTRLTGPYIAPPPSPPPGRTHANATAPTPRTLPNSYRGIPREPGGERERVCVCTATAWTEESRTSAAFHPRPTVRLPGCGCGCGCRRGCECGCVRDRVGCCVHHVRRPLKGGGKRGKRGRRFRRLGGLFCFSTGGNGKKCSVGVLFNWLDYAMTLSYMKLELSRLPGGTDSDRIR